jgi:hypothetical protein
VHDLEPERRAAALGDNIERSNPSVSARGVWKIRY